MQMFQFAYKLHPRLFAGFGLGGEFILDRFGHEFTEWNPARGRRRLCASKNRIGNFQGGLHNEPIIPYLWDSVNVRANPLGMTCFRMSSSAKTGAAACLGVI